MSEFAVIGRAVVGALQGITRAGTAAARGATAAIEGAQGIGAAAIEGAAEVNPRTVTRSAVSGVVWNQLIAETEQDHPSRAFAGGSHLSVSAWSPPPTPQVKRSRITKVTRSPPSTPQRGGGSPKRPRISPAGPGAQKRGPPSTQESPSKRVRFQEPPATGIAIFPKRKRVTKIVLRKDKPPQVIYAKTIPGVRKVPSKRMPARKKQKRTPSAVTPKMVREVNLQQAEPKYYDENYEWVSLNAVASALTPNMVVNVPVQGTGPTHRTGNKVYGVSLELKGLIGDVNDNDVTVRRLVVKDRANQGSSPTLGEILDFASPVNANNLMQACPKWDNRNRFIIMSDRTWNAAYLGAYWNGSAAVHNSNAIQFSDTISVDAQFNYSGVAGTAGDLQKDAIFVFFFCTAGAGSVKACCNSRFKFKDM